MSTPDPNDEGDKQPVTWHWFRYVLRDLTAATKEYTARALSPFGERLDALEKALEAQKANPPTLADAYRGVWQPGEHERGAVVTMGGSLWLCFRTTTSKPGAGDDWRLIVKRGKNAQEGP